MFKKSFSMTLILVLVLSFSMQIPLANAQTVYEWTQTSQADFEAGQGMNVDTVSSPGDIKLVKNFFTNWFQITSANSPTTTGGSVMAYDSSRRKMVLFGGATLNETWEYDGNNWTKIVTPNAPSPRIWYSLVYDSARHKVILFGGYNPYAFWVWEPVLLNDTWEYDGTNWVQINTVNFPSPRSRYVMAYDSTRHVTTLFGGAGYGDNALGDTWEYNGYTWTPIAATTSPSPRYGSAMAYDSSRHKMVLFGGAYDMGWLSNYQPYIYDDTWEYNGSMWTPIATNVNFPYCLGLQRPFRRVRHSLVYDSARQKVILFSGDNNFSVFNDTWEYDADGNNWIRINVTNSPSGDFFPMAYDSVRQVIVLFGPGTWEYGTTFSYQSSGTLTSSNEDTSGISFFNTISLDVEIPSQCGSDGVKFQIATNNDNSTWNFVGPDGTPKTYYTTSGQKIWEGHSGDRYLKYKLFLSTENPNFTPVVHSVTIKYLPGIDGMKAFVESLGLDSGLSNSLLVKLDGAKAKMDSAPDVAENKLEAFVNEIQAQSGKSIDEATANRLIEMARAIINDLQAKIDG